MLLIITYLYALVFLYFVVNDGADDDIITWLCVVAEVGGKPFFYKNTKNCKKQ
jgi:hypothetical protein